MGDILLLAMLILFLTTPESSTISLRLLFAAVALSEVNPLSGGRRRW